MRYFGAMDQFLSDLALIWNGALDATADFWVPLAEIYATMPDWAIYSAVAGIAALLSVIVFGRRRLGGDRIHRNEPILRGGPTDERQADGPPLDGDGQPTLSPIPDAPEIQGLSDILAAQGASPAGRDGRLRTFAGELEDLRNRLDQVGATSSATAKLFHDAKEAIASGDLARGTDLLIRAADEESVSADDLSQSASTHGRAAALGRLVAADLMAARNDEAAAETLYRLAADAAPLSEPELQVECLGRLGSLAHGRGDFGHARDCFAAALAALEAANMEDHPDIGGILNNLGLACDFEGDQDTAERHYQRALAADERTYGDDHANVAAILNNLALLYRREGKTHAAEPLFRRAVAIKEASLMPGDASLALSRVNHAATLRDLGREEDARTLERRAGLPHPEVESEPNDAQDQPSEAGNEIGEGATATDRQSAPAT